MSWEETSAVQPRLLQQRRIHLTVGCMAHVQTATLRVLQIRRLVEHAIVGMQGVGGHATLPNQYS